VGSIVSWKYPTLELRVVLYDGILWVYNRLRGTLGLPIRGLLYTSVSLVCVGRCSGWRIGILLNNPRVALYMQYHPGRKQACVRWADGVGKRLGEEIGGTWGIGILSMLGMLQGTTGIGSGRSCELILGLLGATVHFAVLSCVIMKLY
jgi:hypothetical protein